VYCNLLNIAIPLTIFEREGASRTSVVASNQEDRKSDWSRSGTHWGCGGSDWSLGGGDWSLSGSDWSFGGSDWSFGGSDRSLGGSDWSLGGSDWSLGGGDWSFGGADRSSSWENGISDIDAIILGPFRCSCTSWNIYGVAAALITIEASTTIVINVAIPFADRKRKGRSGNPVVANNCERSVSSVVLVAIVSS
jgi:hypothetical protein